MRQDRRRPGRQWRILAWVSDRFLAKHVWVEVGHLGGDGRTTYAEALSRTLRNEGWSPWPESPTPTYTEFHPQAGWDEVGDMRVRYTVILEQGDESWGAHVPDLPGCVAVGASREEALRLIREAIEFHIEGLRQEGLRVPEPRSEGEIVEIGAA